MAIDTEDIIGCGLVVKFRDKWLAGIEGGSRKDESGISREKFIRNYPETRIFNYFTSLTEERIQSLTKEAIIADPFYSPVNFSGYYEILCPGEEEAIKIMEELVRSDLVEKVYRTGMDCGAGMMVKDSPVFFHQGYLRPAPEGIDLASARRIKGGSGCAELRLIDIEQGWDSDHELLVLDQLELQGFNHGEFRDHGTAVLSVIQMKEDRQGNVGIAPDASLSVISPWRKAGCANEADAILAAISYLQRGDLILIESQSYCHGTGSRLWPVEIQEANYQVIRLATALGITVIEPAGNGDLRTGLGNDLDELMVDGRQILNPESLDFRDSGAIMVAASSGDPVLQRAPYSNYGGRINCFAPGEIHALSHTVRLRGTSGSAAVIAGAAMLVQSIAVENLARRLDPAMMRNMLGGHVFGTRSLNGHSEDRIGYMPDLKKIVEVYFRLV